MVRRGQEGVTQSLHAVKDYTVWRPETPKRHSLCTSPKGVQLKKAGQGQMATWDQSGAETDGDV